jgi:hypothetical protein
MKILYDSLNFSMLLMSLRLRPSAISESESTRTTKLSTVVDQWISIFFGTSLMAAYPDCLKLRNPIEDTRFNRLLVERVFHSNDSSKLYSPPMLRYR